MNQEFEIISHSQMNFKLFLVNMLYRTPHIHKDFELCLLLDGRLFLQAQNETHSLETGDLDSAQRVPSLASHSTTILQPSSFAMSMER